jgi:hypothetical protein
MPYCITLCLPTSVFEHLLQHSVVILWNHPELSESHILIMMFHDLSTSIATFQSNHVYVSVGYMVGSEFNDNFDSLVVIT